MTESDAEIREALVKLASGLQKAAEGFPWADVVRDAHERWESIWWWWNVGFVRAAGRLSRAVVALDREELHDETHLPLRSLAELVANQGYMAEDPKRRAPEFAGADLAARDRLLDKLEALGPPFAFKPADIASVRQEIADERQQLADLLDDADSADEIYPFGKRARTRMKAAGMRWHYDGLYVSSSDFVHMNARAIAGHVGRASEDRPDEPATAKILMADELLLRSLYFGDAALELGRRADLDDYAAEYVRIALPGSDKQAAIQSLWPPKDRPEQESPDTP